MLILWKSAANRSERFLWSIKTCKLDELVLTLSGELSPRQSCLTVREGDGPHNIILSVWSQRRADSFAATNIQ